MKKLIKKLRLWCGTVDANEKNILSDNRGETRIWMPLGAVIILIFAGWIFFASFADCITCGMFSKCVGCATCGICSNTGSECSK